jgi:hypothetical protein
VASRDRASLRHSFGEQLTFLNSSVRAYDDGQPIEAKRIAVVLRTLLHHTASAAANARPNRAGSHALMVQLGWRDSWTWADTAGELNRAGLLPISNLAPARFSAEAVEFRHTGDRWQAERKASATSRAAGLPLLRPPGTFLPFQQWWTMPVIRDSAAQLFNRSDIVRLVANKDGGAHVDPKLPNNYAQLHSVATFGWRVTGPDGALLDVRISPVLPSLRQIAEEFALTVKQHRSALETDPLLSSTT